MTAVKRGRVEQLNVLIDDNHYQNFLTGHLHKACTTLCATWHSDEFCAGFGITASLFWRYRLFAFTSIVLDSGNSSCY